MSSAIYLQDDLISLSEDLINSLRFSALESPLRRARYCLHTDTLDSLQEMIIYLLKNSYIAPHRHNRNPESLTIIKGRGLVIFFDNDGTIRNFFVLGTFTGDIPFYRINRNIWHTLIPLTEFLVIHEISKGPFEKKNSQSASWAPDGKNSTATSNYISELIAKVNNSILIGEK